MESKVKRRKAISIKMALIEGVGKVLTEQGFHKLGINVVSEEANVSKVLIYKHYESFDNLLRAYIEKQDYWLNILKSYGKNPVENQREFMKEMMCNQFDFQLKNNEFSEMLIWELADKEDFASTIAVKREIISQGLISQYSNLLDINGLRFNNFVAILISSMYYLLIHKEKSTFCGVDLNDKKEQEMFKEFICWMIDLVFDKIEEKGKIKEIIIKAHQKGISIEDIAEITGVSIGEVRMAIL